MPSSLSDFVAAFTVVSLAATHAFAGGQSCSPFAITGGSGEIYVITQGNAGTDSDTLSINAKTVAAGGGATAAASGVAGSTNHAMCDGAFSVSAVDGLHFEVHSHGEALAAGAFAFARADVEPLVALSLPARQRIRATWNLYADGISYASFYLRHTGQSAFVLSAEVSAYITPQASEGSTTLVLAAGAYQLNGYCSSQCNVQGSITPLETADYSVNLTIECLALGDIIADGAVDAQDLAALLAAWGTNGAAASADLDLDGIVGSADLALLLSEWR